MKREAQRMAMLLLASSLLGGCMTMPYAQGGTGWQDTAPVPQGRMVPATQTDPLSAYYWIDEASALFDSIGASPPDFSLRFRNADVWGWQSSSGDLLLIEMTPEGPIQYFFAPQDDVPYFVRTDHVSYAFDNWMVAAAYDDSGRLLANLDPIASWALFARGRSILSEAGGRQWDAPTSNRWSAQAPVVYAAMSWWPENYARNDDWVVYRTHHRHDAHDRYRGERERRRYRAEAFYRWQREGRRGPPPGGMTGHPGGPGRHGGEGHGSNPSPGSSPPPMIARPAPAPMPPAATPTNVDADGLVVIEHREDRADLAAERMEAVRARRAAIEAAMAARRNRADDGEVTAPARPQRPMERPSFERPVMERPRFDGPSSVAPSAPSAAPAPMTARSEPAYSPPPPPPAAPPATAPRPAPRPAPPPRVDNGAGRGETLDPD